MKNVLQIRMVITAMLLITTATIKAQTHNPYEEWDRDFKPVHIKGLFSDERLYADTIELKADAEQYYSRVANYRITAKYLGDKRSVNKETAESIRRVFGLQLGNMASIDSLIDKEYKFESEGKEIWIPMESDIQEAFLKEIKKNTVTTLYCTFFNEHTKDKKLYNLFMIAEFRKGAATPY